jgi:dephospho-CoA kinase
MEMWGLTGGIACGKSTVSGMLKSRGAVIVDADQLARQVVAPGSEALKEIVDRFGQDVLQADGALDRKKLGQRVFADEAARQDLGRITHPRIAALAAQQSLEAEAGAAKVVVYDAPLLIENGLHGGMREVLVVACEEATQVARLVRRDGLNRLEALARIHSQMSLDEKRQVATVVIENNGDLEDLKAQVDAFWVHVEPRLRG